MGNLSKCTYQAACSGILEEIERTPDTERTFDKQRHEIDPDRTQYNYSLINADMSAKERLNKRMSEVKCMKRDDVKILGQWVWTMPKDLDEEYREKFFQGIYDFYAAKHGTENICYAQVHMDERTPHMHIGVIPVAPNKKGENRISAKAVFDRNYLQHAHAELQIYLEEQLGTEVNLINGETLGVDGIDKYKEAQDLRREIVELTREKTLLQSDIAELKEEKTELQKDVSKLAKIKEQLSERITEIKEFLKGYPNFVEVVMNWFNDKIFKSSERFSEGQVRNFANEYNHELQKKEEKLERNRGWDMEL